MIEPKVLKGFRDFTPQDVVKRDYVKKKIIEIFHLFGFLPLETPAVEYFETFAGNIGEDEKLFFHFQDQGERHVALRYDQTVPTCRYIALNKNEIAFPFKRYQIQTVWRSEKPQKGRYREFLQCDADIFGVLSPDADAEVIALCISIYQNLGFKEFVVKINDRALYKDVKYEVIVAIDKLAKIGREGVIAEIAKQGYTAKEAAKVLDEILNAQPNDTLKHIFSYLEKMGYNKKHYQFDPSIARSFNYSTGPIWEVVIPSFSAGSVLGGERFDSLVGKFSSESVPGTGFAVGFDRTLEAMDELGMFPTLLSGASILMTVFNTSFQPASLEIIQKLRKEDIPAEIYTGSETKLEKQLKYADKRNIPYVLIVGEEEVKNNTVVIKDMKNNTQQSISQDKLVSFFKKLLP